MALVRELFVRRGFPRRRDLWRQYDSWAHRVTSRGRMLATEWQFTAAWTEDERPQRDEWLVRRAQHWFFDRDTDGGGPPSARHWISSFMTGPVRAPSTWDSFVTSPGVPYRLPFVTTRRMSRFITASN